MANLEGGSPYMLIVVMKYFYIKHLYVYKRSLVYNNKKIKWSGIMNVRKATLILTFAVAVADGKDRGGASTAVSKLMGLSVDELKVFTNDLDEIINYVKTLPNEAIESILATMEFIAIIDKTIDLKEQEVINKIQALLK